jgi:putative DNA primase/helicase
MQFWCEGCQFGGTPIQYLHRIRGGDGKPRGVEFIEIAKEICQKAGVDFPEKEINPEEQERYSFLSQRSALLANIIEFCQGQIRDEHRNYLHSRGFTDADIVDLGIGFYDVAALRKHLAGYDRKLLEGCGVLHDRLNGYLVFPWYDDRKRPLTLYFKWTSKTPPDGMPKTTALSNPKLDSKEVLESKHVPYCFDRARGEKHLVLVEGVTDAALAQVRGDRRVIACVAARLSGGQVETLRRHGVESVTICLDPDKAGENGILSCVKSLEGGQI